MTSFHSPTVPRRRSPIGSRSPIARRRLLSCLRPLGAAVAASALVASGSASPAVAQPAPAAAQDLPRAVAQPASGIHAQPAPAASPSATRYERPTIADGSPAPKPLASSWAVADMDSGDVFASQDLDRQLAPASVMKLLSALALVDVLKDPNQKYEAVFDDMTVDGTKVGLVQKNTYTVDQLFHAMLMSSANDAAHALANAAGGQNRAVELMTAKAQALGLTGTVPKNTSGLDAPGQVTTVRDLLIIAKAVLADGYLMKIIATETYQMPGGTNPDTKEKFAGYPIQNHTKIVGRVDGGLGLKNGYTTKSKGSFVAVVRRGGKTYGSALLHTANGTREAAVDLIDWTFAQRKLQPKLRIPLSPEPTPEPTAAPAQQPAGEHTSAAAPEAATASGPVSLPVILFGAAAVILAAGGIAFSALRRRERRH